MSNFDKAIEVVLKHEGGLVDHPNDPGGLTNFGISSRWARGIGLHNLDIRNLTREAAIDLYKQYFWNAYRIDRIDDEVLATKYFDTLVNTGPSQATKFLQRALKSCGATHVNDDGAFGPITDTAIRNNKSREILVAFCSEQAGFYRLLAAVEPKKSVFLKGWLKRAYWK
jgi:lysozyme family protein